MTIVLIAGGARSGKSRRGLELARELNTDNELIHFIATAQASDTEMIERIRQHQSERKEGFLLQEEHHDLVSALAKNLDCRITIVDCLTLWLSNNLSTETHGHYQEVIMAAKRRPGHTIFITNEVGEGIVPMHPVSRLFRDLSGQMNQHFAREANSVEYMQLGIATKLK